MLYCLASYFGFCEEFFFTHSSEAKPIGVLCTRSLLKSSPRPFLYFRTSNGAELGLQEGRKVLLT